MKRKKKAELQRELRLLRARLRKAEQQPKEKASQPRMRAVSDQVLSRARIKQRANMDALKRERIMTALRPYVPPPGVLPKGVQPIAMDSALPEAMAAWTQTTLGSYWSEGLTFMGYAELSNLTVRSEYRVISQVIATECTRKWITFTSTDEAETDDDDSVLEASEDFPEGEKPGEGQEADVAEDADPVAENLIRLQEHRQKKHEAERDMARQRADQLAKKDGKADRIKELTKEFDRLRVRDLIATMVEFDGYFGRAHVYIDTGSTDDPEELKIDIGDGSNEVTRQKFKQGSLERFKLVEPIWTYPQYYNATDPLKPEWYNPSHWFVMGKQLHASRLLTFVGRPVPDLLKPAYAFGGLSLSQIAKPYIDNWLQTRASVNDIIRAFSVMVLRTDMSSVLQAGPGADGNTLFTRLDLFNQFRDNRGVFAIDKEGEDFNNVSAPLSSLDALQAQAQEHMASVSRIPLVKLLGISPHGLNASSEGELKAFYDTINSYQETFRPQLTTIMHFAMMNLWGEVDEDITFKFAPLWALDEKEEAEVRKVEAETYDILVNGVNAIHPEEVRKVVADDPDSPFQGLDVADAPEAPPPSDTLNLRGNEPFAKGAQSEEGDGEQNQPPPFVAGAAE